MTFSPINIMAVVHYAENLDKENPSTRSDTPIKKREQIYIAVATTTSSSSGAKEMS